MYVHVEHFVLVDHPPLFQLGETSPSLTMSFPCRSAEKVPLEEWTALKSLTGTANTTIPLACGASGCRESCTQSRSP